MGKVRAKFQCYSVEQSKSEPYEVGARYATGETAKRMTWPRTYRFTPQYDPTVPEDQRYAQATPIGELRIQVDNPNVSFEPGKAYYLDFTPVDAEG